MELKKKWMEQGFIDEPFDGTIEELKKSIRRLCEEKQAVVLAHYYTVGDVQKVADFIGDSLALARQAAKTDAKITSWQRRASCSARRRRCCVLT